ncbi:MAG: CpsD/CapB family tyrosine-protein kinase [Terriglobales bacterium]
MGLFYKALQRAQPEQPESGAPAADAVPQSAPAAAAPRTWADAADVDLAGFPLGEGEAAAAPAEVVTRRSVRLRQPVWEAAAAERHAGGKRKLDAAMALEQSRILRTRVLEAMHARGLQALLVSSALPGEGKSLVASGLALQISLLRQARVLLVDADLRRAGMTAYLDPAPKRGLEAYLRGEAEAGDLVLDVDPYLAVLPTCTAADAAELLASERMSSLLRWARRQFDWVLLDGAPLELVADSRILARLAGGVLLVARAGVSGFQAVQDAAALVQPYLLGTVLNGARRVNNRHYGYGYDALPGTEQKALEG